MEWQFPTYIKFAFYKKNQRLILIFLNVCFQVISFPHFGNYLYPKPKKQWKYHSRTCDSRC